MHNRYMHLSIAPKQQQQQQQQQKTKLMDLLKCNVDLQETIIKIKIKIIILLWNAFFTTLATD